MAKLAADCGKLRLKRTRMTRILRSTSRLATFQADMMHTNMSTHPKPNEESPFAKWMTIIIVWSLFGLWYANQVFFSMQMRGMHHFYWRMLIWGQAMGHIWTPLTPLILLAATRFPIERPRVIKSVFVHFGFFLATTLMVSLAETAMTMLIRPFEPITPKDSFGVQYIQSLPGAIAYTMFIYAAVCSVGHALEYRRRAREGELQAARLEALVSQAQVLSLKMQLHPHFLFNTLNGVVALVREGDNDNAIKMLLGLSNMLRYALDSSGRQEVPLSEEIEFLNLYLGVEQMRFPDRLKIVMAIDADTEQAMVPSLMLQPLVENAIRHGIAPRLKPGTVRVAARREGDSLVVDVEDDGVGMTSEHSDSGICLKNTRSRLAQLYQGACDLTIGNRSMGGVGVRLTLPFRTA